jgi:RimJ/RimL family protein N-acetyltransferase
MSAGSAQNVGPARAAFKNFGQLSVGGTAYGRGAGNPDPAAVRLLIAHDAQAYLEFRKQALATTPEAFTSTPEEEAVRPLSWALDRISEQPDQRFVVGAFLADQLVGIAGFSRAPERQASHKGLLFGMAVEPKHGGRGIGRSLVEAVQSHARSLGVRQINLTVTSGNIPAMALYQRCGFREFGREPRAVIVGGREVAKVHMVCMLDQPAREPDALYLDGLMLRATSIAPDSVVSLETCLILKEQDGAVSGDYSGGQIRAGRLFGRREDRELHFHYVQVELDGSVHAGSSRADMDFGPDGRMRLSEHYKWSTRPGSGINVFEEVPLAHQL